MYFVPLGRSIPPCLGAAGHCWDWTLRPDQIHLAESLTSQLPNISLTTLIPAVGQGKMAYGFSSTLESNFSSAKFWDCRVGTSWLDKQLNMHELELLLGRKCNDFIHVDTSSSLMDNTALERWPPHIPLALGRYLMWGINQKFSKGYLNPFCIVTAARQTHISSSAFSIHRFQYFFQCFLLLLRILISPFLFTAFREWDVT